MSSSLVSSSIVATSSGTGVIPSAICSPVAMASKGILLLPISESFFHCWF